jgi:hypothetical protein
MSYFSSEEELYHYLGGVFRAAQNHPEVGPVLRGSGITLRLEYKNPTAILTIAMLEDGIEVIEGESDVVPDIRMAMSSDNADKYWRGEFNVAVGLAKGEVKAKGPVTKILKLIPVTKPLFPIYRELVAGKDAAT